MRRRRAAPTRPRTVTLRAPAKLNLCLEVLGRRPDGYHALAMVMQCVSLADTVRIRRDGRPGGVRFGLRGSGAGGVPRGAANLCVRAAALFREETGLDEGIRIDLVKRIPAGAGLGGGSSDAAAVLAGLEMLFERRLPRRRQMALAARLGSDVPFFLAGTAALCRGRGERVFPFAVRKTFHYVLVLPPVSLATSRVYAAHRNLFTGVRENRLRPPGPWSTLIRESLRRGDARRLGRLLRNDLETAAFRLEPRLSRLRRGMAALPFLGVSMTGSGSAFFGVTGSAREAERLAARLRAGPAARGARVLAVRSLPSGETALSRR